MCFIQKKKFMKSLTRKAAPSLPCHTRSTSRHPKERTSPVLVPPARPHLLRTTSDTYVVRSYSDATKGAPLFFRRIMNLKSRGQLRFSESFSSFSSRK